MRTAVRIALTTTALALLAAVALAASPSPSSTAAPAASAGSAPASAAASSSSDIQLSNRAYAIASQLRCPVCTAESVADSNAQISAEMRHLIQRQLDEGKSPSQIIAYFRQRYGDWILLDPPKTGVHLLVWLLPLIAALAGVAALAVLVRRWRAAAEAMPQAAEEDVERVRQAMHVQEDEG